MDEAPQQLPPSDGTSVDELLAVRVVDNYRLEDLQRKLNLIKEMFARCFPEETQTELQN